MTRFRPTPLHARSALVLRSAGAAVAIRGLSSLTAVLMLPAYLSYFGASSRLGTWLAILSVVNWVLTLDFGVGNALRNSIVRDQETGNWAAIRNGVLGTLAASAVISFVMMTLGTVAILCAARRADHDGLRVVWLWLLGTVCVQLVLRVGTFAAYAIQRSYVNNLTSLGTSLLLLTFLICARSLDSSSKLKLLGPAYFIAANLPLIVLGFWLGRGPLRQGLPRHFEHWRLHARVAFHGGMIFFSNQLLYTAILGTSVYFVSLIGGADAVVAYQAHYTLFSLTGTLALLALTPLWSAVTHAFAQRDYLWIVQSLTRCEVAGMTVCLVPVLLALVISPLMHVWLGRAAVPTSASSSVAFCLFGLGYILHGIVATFAAGLGKMRLQAIFYALGFLGKVCLLAIGQLTELAWICVPAYDGCILLLYFLFERVSLRNWLKAAESA